MHEGATEPESQEIQKADPDYLAPCHRAGWKATKRIIQLMPEKFIQYSVITHFSFED